MLKNFVLNKNNSPGTKHHSKFTLFDIISMNNILSNSSFQYIVSCSHIQNISSSLISRACSSREINILKKRSNLLMSACRYAYYILNHIIFMDLSLMSRQKYAKIAINPAIENYNDNQIANRI